MRASITLYSDEIQGLLTTLLKDKLGVRWDTLTINQGPGGEVNNYTIEDINGVLRSYDLYGNRVI